LRQGNDKAIVNKNSVLQNILNKNLVKACADR
jgi:hypothetical protein